MTRTRGTPWHALRALVAASVAAFLLVAVPIGLWQAVGWPLPRVLPPADTLNAPIPDTVLIKTLAVVCWLAWSHLVFCLVVEAIGHARGRATPRIPWSGGTQHLARWLVTSIAMVSISMQKGPVPPLPAEVISHTVAVSQHEHDFIAPTARTALRSPDVPLREYTVERRDTLWGIAERHLGDPFRWPELLELNRGRMQADGGSLIDPGLIQRGWVLRMPTDAVGLAKTAALDPAPDPHAVVVAPGDSLSELANEELGDAQRWPELFELNRGRPQPDGQSLHEPDVIRPGWVIGLPADSGTSPGEVPSPAANQPVVAQEPIPEVPAPTTPATPAPTTGTQAPTTVQSPGPGKGGQQAESNEGGARVPFGILGAGLAAAGLVVTLDRVRRVEQRRRVPGRPPHVPPAHLAEPEHALRIAAEEAQPTVDRLDLVLRAMARGLADRPRDPAPAVLAVQLGPERFELLLANPDTAPPQGFTSTDDGWVWVIDAADIDDLRSEAEWVAPLPGLVTIGMAKGGPLLVDLETAGSAQVLGRRDDQLALLSQFALELSTSTWADVLNVVVIGLDVPGLATLNRVRTAACLDDVIEAIEMEAAAFKKELAVTGFASTFGARTGQRSSDGWAPTIVLCAEPQDAASAARLTAVGGDGGQGVALVVAGDVPGSRWTFTCDTNRVAIAPLGLEVTTELVTTDEVEIIDALIDDALTVDDAPPVGADIAVELDLLAPQPPDGAEAPSLFDIQDPAHAVAHANGSARATEPAIEVQIEVEVEVEAEAEVEVRLLGPIEIVGGAERVPEGKLSELVSYLATHPAGVDGDRLQCALWPPDKPPSPKTFANAVSNARQRLGSRHFPPAGNEVYRLADTVTTDIARFEAMIRRAKGQPDATATTTLRSALDLVRGRPFTAVHGFHWAQPEGLVAHAEALVVDAAHRLAQLCLEAADLQGGESAAAAGLLASPGNEALFRDRMLAADAAGNPAGVEAVMNELCEFVEAVEPYDELHPETVALYERLSRRHARSTPTRERAS